LQPGGIAPPHVSRILKAVMPRKSEDQAEQGRQQPVVNWHAVSRDQTLQRLRASRDGLTTTDAAVRLGEYGPNALPEPPRRAAWRVFARQFASPLIYILFAAAALAFWMGEHSDAGVILVVVLLNAVIGAFQEGRAERSMESLRQLSQLKVRVRREGHEREIEARELVPGDVLLLAAGDAVGADARLLEAAALATAEAALTGESLPVEKRVADLEEDTVLGDRRNMVYAGTQVTSGRGTAIVVATGLGTEVGKIAEMTSAAVEPKTPLELRLAQFGRYLVGAALVLFVVIVGFGVLRGLPIGEVLMVAVSQMVSMVPEGLPVAMTIALAVGMQRMARRGAIVRRLAAVETLGSTSVICSDKTGTLTRNEMTVTTAWLPDGRSVRVAGIGYEPTGALSAEGGDIAVDRDPGLRPLLEAVALCNDAQLLRPDEADPRWRAVGDPTEAALVTLAMKGGIDIDRLRQECPREHEIPFDAATKMMATQHGPAGAGRILIKGAPELLLELCGQARRGAECVALEPALREAAAAAESDFGTKGLRVLAMAEVPPGAFDEKGNFAQFAGRAVLLGLVAQMDPPRDEVKVAVARCRTAGIRPVMVTGDHKSTGLAVARMLGIARDGDRAVDGRELEAMSEAQLRDGLAQISVFARVHPAQKLRIVEALQARGEVVAMTGDGVNDAPALARADVGVAMGITGTEVAKGAAKIVITDDNFATIVTAVEEGRLVYRNLKKVILFLFTTSIDEVIILLAALLLGYPLPLAAVQILWINLVTEGTLTVNLIMEPLEGDEMRIPPIPPRERLITRAMLARMALLVPASVVATFGYYAWRLSTGAPFPVVQSETFTLLAVCQWFNVLNCASETRSVFRRDTFRNGWLIGGLVAAILLQLAVVYWPAMNRIFHTTPISFQSALLILAAGSLVLWVDEARKILARRRERARQPAAA
jgi:Ca2+-transporting ATPase